LIDDCNGRRKNDRIQKFTIHKCWEAIHKHCEGNSNVTQQRCQHSLKSQSWIRLTEAGIGITER
jgi:hypothetical protein